MRSLVLAVALMSGAALAKPVQKPVAYEVAGAPFEGVLVYDDAVKTPRPGLLMAPNWMSITGPNLAQAQALAGTRYVLFVADLYGKAVRPKNPEEAGKAAGPMKADRQAMRARMTAALAAFLGSKAPGLDPSKIGALGFCIGGTSVLELARAGANVAGVVSLHGGLDSPTPADGKNIKAKVLALHGAEDPMPPEDLVAFEEELRQAKVDWELVKYGGAVHSFTDPNANQPGRNQYNPKVAKRAFERMHAFFDEAFKK